MRGYKTYIVAVIAIVYGVMLYTQGQTEQGTKIILEALGLAALRAGVTKSGPSGDV